MPPFRLAVADRQRLKNDGVPTTAHRLVGGQRFCRADYQRRERHRQMKKDEARAPRRRAEEFFRGV